MATINQIPMTIMGNIVKDLDPKRTAGGKTVITFRVAQASSTERNGKWEDGETTFIRCVAYGALADHMIASGIRKGTRVIVTSRFVQRDWADRDRREAQQLRTQRRRHRHLHPLCDGPDHQSQRNRRTVGIPAAADSICADPASPRSERRSMARHGPGPIRRTTGTYLLKNKNSRAHDI